MDTLPRSFEDHVNDWLNDLTDETIVRPSDVQDRLFVLWGHAPAEHRATVEQWLTLTLTRGQFSVTELTTLLNTFKAVTTPEETA